MPIVSEINGDLVKLGLNGEYKAIVQGCNCFCTMGAGLAPQIKKAWPQAYIVDSETESGNEEKLGSFTYHHDYDVGVTIFNLYTQFGFGGYNGEHDVNYQAVAECFGRLNSFLTCNFLDYSSDNRKVGIPMIGAGLAGGHWEAIKTIINLVTPDIEIELVNFVPPKVD